ncbi:MAG: cell wall-active antibiotics response protein [Chloroflexota bacterium]
MFSNGRKIFAIFLVTAGTAMLLAILTGRNSDGLFWPLAIMFIGLWFVFRPATAAGENFKLRFATDISEYGEWQVKDEEMYAFAHDIDYDLTQATIPTGETHVRVTGFASDLTVRAPQDVGIAINTNAFVTESIIQSEKQEHIMMGFNYVSPNYAEAERKISFEINSFAVEVKII